tara:strand:+ start:1531 stop:2148 length:618 start_codon:yes stop_codon:yes gene_type:complete
MFFQKLKKIIYKISPYSQAGQDLFAIELFGKKGSYIDIGSGHPEKGSNSYLLEVLNEWKGFSIDNSKKNKDAWEKSTVRNNKVYWDDAVTFDYLHAVKENNLNNDIDFLSCDIDPQEKTFAALQKVINDGIRPKYIAFETDQYNSEINYSELAELFLKPYNYKIGVKNVYSKLKKNKIFETWFIKNSLNYKTIEYSNWVNKINRV